MKWIKFFYPIQSIPVEQADQMIKKKGGEATLLVDVREPVEYMEDHIPESKLIPLREIGRKADELDREKTILLYCRSGSRSKLAARILAVKGFTYILNVSGGILAWNKIRKPETSRI